jgi:glycosyltransferase involved in cell wall biosynthesis
MTLPRLTIVVPSFNASAFIAATLKSIIEQSYPDLEILVSDGGSTDGTQEILRRFGHRIRWISEKDAGQSDAINKGLRVASGEIVAWLNSNDLFLPGSLLKVGSYFVNHPEVGFVFGKAKLLSESGEILGDYEEAGKQKEISQEMTRLNAVSNGHFDRLLNYHPGWVPQMTAFWRTALSRELGYLETDLHYAMDYEYWLRLGTKGRIHFIDEYLGAFRLHGNAKSSDAKELWREILSVRWQYRGRFFCHLHEVFLRLAWRGLVRRLHGTFR